jgi:pectate lyase
MRHPMTAPVVSAIVLSLLAGCAPVDDGGDPAAETIASSVKVRACPEAVTLDDRGDPRNAAGYIRNCWPSEARCFCDADKDCYRLPRYVACVPVTAAATTADAGAASAPTTTTRGTAADGGAVTADSGTAAPQPVAPPVDAGVTGGATTPSSGLRAFPGAEGFGASATGGRGGRVIYVTNLNTSGAGSFQDALQQTGPRYILFKVSGVINASAWLGAGDVTVAGQTSPAGVTVRGFDTTEAVYCDQQCGANARGVSNFIVRHLRTRPAGGNFPDALRLRYARNGIIDHLSMGNAEDESVEISYANNLTIQDSILAETLGDHAQYGGMLINYTNPAAGYALDNLTIVRNVWNRIQGRMPEFSRESGAAAAGTTLHVELTNNLLWDQRYFIDVNPTNISGANAGSPIYYQMNWVGNSSFAPAANHFGTIWIQPSGGGTSAYFEDNRSNLWSARQDWDLNYCCNDYNGGAAARPAWARSTRHPFPAVTVMPAASVRAYAVANAGAFPRDPMDRRLMGNVSAGTFDSRPNNVNPANDALALNYAGVAPAAPVDTDSDGMPDAWEIAKGLNPSAQDHNGTSLSVAMTGVAGYTNLECYLNELAVLRVRNNR